MTPQEAGQLWALQIAELDRALVEFRRSQLYFLPGSALQAPSTTSEMGIGGGLEATATDLLRKFECWRQGVCSLQASPGRTVSVNTPLGPMQEWSAEPDFDLLGDLDRMLHGLGAAPVVLLAGIFALTAGVITALWGAVHLGNTIRHEREMDLIRQGRGAELIALKKAQAELAAADPSLASQLPRAASSLAWIAGLFALASIGKPIAEGFRDRRSAIA